MQAAVVSSSKEADDSKDAGNKPQEQADKVNPDSVLHPLYTRVHLCLLVNVHRPKETEDCAPENKEDYVPGEQNRYGHV